jgi:hypothetical protein
MDYKNIVANLLKSTNREGIENLIEYLDNSDYFVAPASSNFHGNIDGGLVKHSYQVYKILAKLSETFKRNIEPDSIIISSLLHDLCKVNFYKKIKKWKKDEKNKWVDYDGYEIEDISPLGHGCKSVILLKDFIRLKDFELYSIVYHMGIPEGYSDKMSFNKAVSLYPNIILLHLSDFMSSTIFENTTTK